MTVSTAAAGAGPEAEIAVEDLRNPDGVSEAAIKDGLDLYDRIMACEDPNLRGSLQSAMQVHIHSSFLSTPGILCNRCDRLLWLRDVISCARISESSVLLDESHCGNKERAASRSTLRDVV